MEDQNTPQVNSKFENKDGEDAKVACLFHLLYFANVIFPFIGIVGLIIIRACRTSFSDYLATQWREAINFNIAMFVYGIFFALLVVIVIGIPLLFLLFLFSVIMPIIASLKVLDGQTYRYPLIFRLI